MCACVSVCMCVCLSVCLSGYTFPHFSTDFLQIWRTHFTGHDTMGYLFLLCTQRARVRAKRARAC
jgi:hypothetical protein